MRQAHAKSVKRSLKWNHSSSNSATLDPRGWFKTEKKETAVYRGVYRGEGNSWNLLA